MFLFYWSSYKLCNFPYGTYKDSSSQLSTNCETIHARMTYARSVTSYLKRSVTNINIILTQYLYTLLNLKDLLNNKTYKFFSVIYLSECSQFVWKLLEMPQIGIEPAIFTQNLILFHWDILIVTIRLILNITISI